MNESEQLTIGAFYCCCAGACWNLPTWLRAAVGPGTIHPHYQDLILCLSVSSCSSHWASVFVIRGVDLKSHQASQRSRLDRQQQPQVSLSCSPRLHCQV